MVLKRRYFGAHLVLFWYLSNLKLLFPKAFSLEQNRLYSLISLSGGYPFLT